MATRTNFVQDLNLDEEQLEEIFRLSELTSEELATRAGGGNPFQSFEAFERWR